MKKKHISENEEGFKTQHIEFSTLEDDPNFIIDVYEHLEELKSEKRNNRYFRKKLKYYNNKMKYYA